MATSEPTLGGATLVIIAGYERTDWSLAAQIGALSSTVMVTTRFSHGRAMKALVLGLMGYLDVNLPDVALRRALQATLNNEPAFPREVLGRWVRMQRLLMLRSVPDGTLTPRQQEVAGLIAKGAADKEIAAVLGISTVTAQKHAAHILDRLQVPNRAAAVAVLSAHGFP
jgi:DNA-binding NarL/FixJ family response regulator